MFKNYLKGGEFAFSKSFKFLIKIIQIFSNFCHSEIFFEALKIAWKYEYLLPQKLFKLWYFN